MVLAIVRVRFNDSKGPWAIKSCEILFVLNLKAEGWKVSSDCIQLEVSADEVGMDMAYIMLRSSIYL